MNYLNNSASPDLFKDKQVLSLWHVSEMRDFTYGELLHIGEKKLKSLYRDVSDMEILEAMSIIDKFKHDVEESFPH